MTNPELPAIAPESGNYEVPMIAAATYISAGEVAVADRAHVCEQLFSNDEWNEIARRPEYFRRQLGKFPRPRRRGKLILLTDYDQGEMSIFAENKRLSMDWLKLRETIKNHSQANEKFMVQYEVPPLGRRL